MSDRGSKVLVYGYGNPGRLDDGLGPACAEALEKLDLEGVSIDSNYQLSVEDAAALADHDYVLFVDADTVGPSPFWVEELQPKASLSFSSHSVKPEALLAMAHDLMGGKTRAFLMGIRGYEFNEFAERLSEKARANLDAAVAFVVAALRADDFVAYLEQAPAPLRAERANEVE